MALNDIRSMKLFAPLTDEECTQVAEKMSRLELPAGTVVLQAGEPSDSLYFIHSGSVQVLTAIADKQVQLATLGECEHFGDMAIVDGGGISATVQSAESVVLWVLSRKDFEGLADKPVLAYKLWRALAESLTDRMRSSNRAISNYVKINHNILTNETFRDFYKLCQS